MTLPAVLAQPPKVLATSFESSRWLEDLRRELNLLRVYRKTAITLTSNGESVIGVDTSAAITITLGSSDLFVGRRLTIKDETGSAATNNITVDTEGSETIDGAASKTVSTNYGYITVYSDGTNWFVIT